MKTPREADAADSRIGSNSILNIRVITEAAVIILLSIYFLCLLNLHMDEAQIAYPLGCYYSPLNVAGNLREACWIFDLRLPFWLKGPALPLRVAPYVGAIQTVLYYPFWLLIGDVMSVRIFRLFLFFVTAWATARVAGVPRAPVLAYTAAFMPLTFMAIGFAVEEIIFCLVAYFLVLLSYPWQKSSLRKFAGGLLLGTLLSFGIMMRLNFLLSIPGLIAALIIFLRWGGQNLSWRSIAAILAGFFISALTISGLVLTSVDYWNKPYGSILTYGTPRTSPMENLHLIYSKTMDLLPKPLKVAAYHREYKETQNLMEAVAMGLSLFGLLIGCYWRAGFRALAKDTAPWLAYAALTMPVILSNPQTYGWHHLLPAFAVLPILVALSVRRFLETRTEKRRWPLAALTAIYFIAGISLFIRVLALPVPDRLNGKLPQWLDSLRQQHSSNFVLWVDDWGAYYTLLASGDPQLALVWPWNYKQESFDSINRVRQLTGRGLLFIYLQPKPPNQEAILTNTYGTKKIVSKLPGTNWIAAELIPPPVQ